MADIKLFRVQKDAVTEIPGASVAVEKSLQQLLEQNLDAFLGVRFLKSEHSTGKTHGGRIDTLGIDENGCPVIIEYKRAINENVVNQGLFYLDWLLDHKADFKLLVMDALGSETVKNIEWKSPRLLCIAGDYNRYDVRAVQQMNRNIELIRYRRYGNELLLLELVNATSGDTEPPPGSKSLGDRFESLKAFLLALGDDVQVKTLKYYIAFKRIKNFACVEIHPQKKQITVFVKVDPDTIELEKGFTRDVREIGHYGTGDLKILIMSEKSLERAKPLLIQSYEAS